MPTVLFAQGQQNDLKLLKAKKRRLHIVLAISYILGPILVNFGYLNNEFNLRKLAIYSSRF